MIRPPKLILSAGILALLLLALALWFLPQEENNTSLPAPDRIADNTRTEPSPAPPNTVSAANLPALDTSLQSLKQGSAPAETSQALENLRNELESMPREQAIAWIREYLESNQDIKFPLPFKVGPNGQLELSPTLRTFLLDEWGRLDPVSAAEYARTLLQTSTQPSEWTLGMRNLAWADQQGQNTLQADTRTLLSQKTHELINQADWLATPTGGFLEAFDLIPYLQLDSEIQRLTELMQPEQHRALRFAAYMSLEQMAIEAPTNVIAELIHNPDWMADLGPSRAGFIARLDISDPSQQSLFTEYLLNPAFSIEEKTIALQDFPNNNRFLGHRLLSPLPGKQTTKIPSYEALDSWKSTLEENELSNDLLLLIP